MAVYLDVFLERSQLPTCIAWAGAISREGFSLTFPQTVDLTTHTGYLPAVFQDEESGFEFSISALTEMEGVPDNVHSILPAADAVAEFRFHEMDECLAATVAAAVLACLTNGVVWDPQSSQIFQGREAIADARVALNTAKQENAKRPEKLPPLKWAKAFE